MAFTGLTPALCTRALNIIKPSIELTMTNGTVKRPQGCLVVLNPAIPYEPKYKTWSLDPDDPFEDVVLSETFWGSKDEWPADFQMVARSKAFASWKTGLPTHVLQYEAPYLNEPFWTKWPGSAVGTGGLVAAFSGVQWWYDRMFSEMEIAALRGVCMNEMHDPDTGVMYDPDVTFLGT